MLLRWPCASPQSFGVSPSSLLDLSGSENMVVAQPRGEPLNLSLRILSGNVHIAGISKGTHLLQLIVRLPAQPLDGLLGSSSISKKSPGRFCLALRLILSCGRHLGVSECLSSGTKLSGLLTRLQCLPSKPGCVHRCFCGR